MRLEDARKHVGEVIILDLVSGIQLTTKLLEVTEDGYVKFEKPLIFQVSVEPKNPMMPPSEANPLEHRVRNGAYGFPLFEVQDGKEIDVNHIIMIHPTHPDMEKVYLQATSGIQIAGAGALNALDAANQQQKR